MEVNAQQPGLFWWKRGKVELDLGDECEGAFRACEQGAEIEVRTAGGKGRCIYKQVQRVAGIAAFDAAFGKLVADRLLILIVAEYAADLAVEPAFGSGVVAAGVELIGVEGAKGR